MNERAEPEISRLGRSVAPRLLLPPDSNFRAAMLRIGPTIYNHTPYARVHRAFLPLFEGAIRQRAPRHSRKLTFFSDFSRLRIALSLDKNMADENDARGGSAGRELSVLNWRQGDLSPRPPGYCRCHPHSVRVRDASRYFRMPSRPATIEGVHSAEVWQPGEGKQALAYKRRVEWRSRYRDNRTRRGGAPSGRPVTIVQRERRYAFPIPCPITVVTACHRAHQHAHSRRMSVHGHKSQFPLPSHRERRSRDRQDGRRDLGPDGKPSRLDRAAARHFDQPDGGADPTPQQSGRGREVWSAISQRAPGRRFCVHPPFRSRIGSFAPELSHSARCSDIPKAAD